MKKHGVLLAISSLPGNYGIGDFSDETFKFIKLLSKHNINVWQILPLNPIGYGNSPYQPFSSFAFDEIYISLEDLVKRGLISKVNKVPNKAKTDYVLARKIKEKAIYEAFEVFKKSPKNLKKLDEFLLENQYVKEYAEFISLKELNGSNCWADWSMTKEDKINDFNYLFLKHAFAQFILFEEWAKIRKYAANNNIEIIGDVPFYVGYDSSDVYFHKESFMLDENHNPTCVAGVPPDYFCKDGQRWGNPIWNWDYLYENEFKAMLDRIHFASKFYDIIRIDHFRAFDSYWSINPSCLTAIDGEWKYPNGYLFFDTLYRKYPETKIIAEDLGGDLRQEVYSLRDHYNFPGMRVLEFSIFDDEINNSHIEKEQMVYYTSTHDNETLLEWISKLDNQDKNKLDNKMNELGFAGKNLTEKLIKYALSRKENLVVIPASDILNLNKTHRMNKPGEIDQSNWTFKLKSLDKLSRELGKFF